MLQSARDLLQKELCINLDETRLEMVRTSIIVYVGCIATILLSLGTARSTAVSNGGSMSIMAVAAMTALLLWVYRRRVPVELLIAQVPYAALLLALAIWLGEPEFASMLSLFYVLVVLYGTFFLRTRAAATIIVFCSLVFAAVVFQRGGGDWLAQMLMVFGASVTALVFVGWLVKRIQERAVRDPLTGLLNRRMWDSLVRQEFAKAERNKQPFSILLIDLNGFKAINDEHGHLYGDEVLKGVADGFGRVLRDADAPCRWGGDEFAVLLTNCDADKARVAADRLRRAMDDQLALSFGMATWREGRSIDDLFNQADKSLYAAKAG